jgi:hypothetical protein
MTALIISSASDEGPAEYGFATFYKQFNEQHKLTVGAISGTQWWISAPIIWLGPNA